MAEGQSLGGIYISISADISNLKSAVKSATDLVNKFQDTIKEVKLEFDDSGVKKIVDSMKELSKTVQTTYSGLGAKTKEIVENTRKLSQEQVKATGTQRSLTEAMRVYQDLLTKTGQITKQSVEGYRNYENVLKSLSARYQNLEVSQSTLKLKNVISQYDTAAGKLKLFKTYMDQLISSLAVYSEQNVAMTSKESEVVSQVNARMEKVRQLTNVYKQITNAITRLQEAQAQGVSFNSEDFAAAKKEIQELASVMSKVSGGEIKIYTGKFTGVTKLIQDFQNGRTTISKVIDQLREDFSKLSMEGITKFKIGEEFEKAGQKILEMRDRLEVLISVQAKGSLSFEQLSEQIKIYKALMSQGVITDEESKRMNRLIETLNLLKIKFIDLAAVQEQLKSKTLAQESIGKPYDAIIDRLKIYKKTIQDVAVTLGQLGVRSVEQTKSEQTWSRLFRETSTSVNDYIVKLQNLKKTQDKISEIKEFKANKEFTLAREAVAGLNKDLSALGLRKISITIGTSELNKAAKGLQELKTSGEKEINELVTYAESRFKELSPQIKIEGLDAKRTQMLDDATEKLKIYGEQEKAGIDITQARTERIKALQEALKATNRPQEQAQRFLKDQIQLEQSYIGQLDQEIQRHPINLGLVAKRAMEQNKLNRLLELSAKVSSANTKTEAEQIEIYKELRKYTSQLTANVGKLSGRYHGLQQAISSFVGDIKNLIQVQIRWYASQQLIFRSVRAIQSAFSFYTELEMQISRVTSAVASQYNVLEIQKEAMKAVKEEMIRTGKAAQDLATILWELISAGLTHNEAMAGLRHITNLATGSELELSETTRIAAGLFRLFGDEVKKAGSASDKWQYIMDRLAATLNQSQVDVNSLVSGLGYLINESTAVGLQLEQVLGILSVLNNRLLLGSKAGRSASRVLTSLTSNAKELSKAFGIDIDFSKPLDLIDVLTKLNKSLKDSMVNGELTTLTFDKLQDIFGQVGKRAAVGLILNLDELNKTVEGLKTDKFDGLAEAMANVKIEPLKVQIAKLGNSIQILTGWAFAPLIESFGTLIRGLNHIASSIQALSDNQIVVLTARVLSLWLAFKGLSLLLSSKLIGLTTSATVLGFIAEAATGLYTVIKRVIVATISWNAVNVATVSRLGLLRGAVTAFSLSLAGLKASLTALNINPLGLLLVGITLAVYGGIKAFQHWKNATKDAIIAAEKAQEQYTETVEKIRNESIEVEDLAKEYSKSIPYSQEWFDLREKIKRQYPEIYESLIAEIDATGELTEAIKRFKAEKAIEYALSDKATEAYRANALAIEKAKNMIERFGSFMLDIRDYFQTDTVEVYAYNEALQKMSKESDTVSKGVLLMYRKLEPIPKVFQLVAKSMRVVGTQVDNLYAIRDALETTKESTGEVTAGLRRMILEAKETIPGLEGIEIGIKTRLDPKELKNMIATVEKVASNISENAFKNVNLEPLINEIQYFDKVAKYTGAIDNRSAALQRFQKFVDNFSKTIPKNLYDLFVSTDTTIDAILRSSEAKYQEQLENAGNAEEELEIRIKIMQETLKRFIPAFEAVLNTNYIQTLRRMSGLIKEVGGVNAKNVEEVRSKLRSLWSGLSPDAKKSAKLFFGGQFSELETFLEGTEEGFDKVFGKEMQNKFKKIGELLDNNITNSFKSNIIQLENLTSAAARTRQAYDSIISTIELLGAKGGTIIEKYLENNKKIIDEVTKTLPGSVREIIQNTSGLEKLELIKMVKDVNIEIAKAESEFGVSLTPEFKTEIAIKKYREMYDKMNILSKKFYEDEISESRKETEELQKNLESIAKTKELFINKDIAMIQKRAELDLKYEKELQDIRAKKESAKVLSLTPKEQNVYRELTADAKEYDEQIARSDEIIKRAADSIDILHNAQKKFKDILISENAATSIRGILEKSIPEFKNFIAAQDDEIGLKFDDFFINITDNQRAYVEKFINTLVEKQGIDIEKAKVLLRNLLRDMTEINQKDIISASSAIESKAIDRQQKAEENKRAYNAKLVSAEGQLRAQLLLVTKERLQDNNTYQLLEVQEKRIHLEKIRQLNEFSWDLEKQRIKILENVRQQDLKNLQDYMRSIRSITSRSALVDNLTQQVNLEVSQYDLREKRLREDINYYDKAQSEIVEKIKLAKREAELAAKGMPSLAPDEEMLKLKWEAATRAAQKELEKAQYKLNLEQEKLHQTRETTLVSRGKWFPTADELEQLKPLTDAVAEAQAKLEGLMTRHDAFFQRTSQDTIQASNILETQLNRQLDLIRRNEQATENELKDLHKVIFSDVARISESVTKEIQSYMEDVLATQAPLLKAEYIAGKFDPKSLDGLKKGLDSGLNSLKTEIQNKWSEVINSALLNKVIKTPEEADFLSKQITQIIDIGLIKSTSDYDVKIKQALEDAITKGIADIGTTGALIGFEIPLSGLQVANFELQKFVALRRELVSVEQERLPLLKDELDNELQSLDKTKQNLPKLEKEIELLQAAKKLQEAALDVLKLKLLITQDQEKVSREIALLEGEKAETDEQIKAKSIALVKEVDNYKKGLVRVNELSKEAHDIVAATGTIAQKSFLAAYDSIMEFSTAATNTYENVQNLISTTLEGLSSAISNSMSAIFTGPTQEIESAKQQLGELEKEKEKISKKMKLIEVGGVLPEQLDEYRQLQEQWKGINDQIIEANGNLNDLESTGKRVGEAFRAFGQTILKTLQDMIAKIIVFNLLQGFIGGLFPTSGLAKSLTKFLAKGGVVEGGFQPISRDQLSIFKKMNLPFFGGGGVASGPTLGVIGEGRNTEAVVPLPDNKHIPVKFTGNGIQGSTQDVKIVNLLDPKMVPQIMLQHPDAILNVINQDITKRGPIYQLIKNIR